MRTFLFTVVFSVFVSIANAQVIPTHYDYDIVGTASSTYTFPASSVTCGPTAPGQPTTVNPRYLVWDSDVATQVCVHDTGNNTGPLFALPIGDYSVTLYAVAQTATNRVRSLPSNVVPFSRLVPPAARTGLRVRSAQ